MHFLTEKSDEVRELATLKRILEFVELWTVLPGALAVIIFGIILALRTKRPILSLPQGGEENWLLLAL